MTTTRLIDDSIFTDLEGAHEVPALAGSACEGCGTTTFPRQSSCPRCGGVAMSDTALAREGTIWSATVQHFPPKPPFRFDGDFQPFGMGYVDLGAVIVESRFTEGSMDRLAIGTPVELTLLPAFTDEDGTQVLTFAFAPTHREESA
ncbi:MAG: hypothetical protein JWO76_876 [Nocardioides sp.]|nr:hypothetical protein [Nocardioides sp.]